MSQKRKARNWHENLRVKTHDLVRFENAYFLNISGRNSSPENGPDWLYLGEVERFGNFASNNGSNLTDITNWQNVLGINDFNGDNYIEKPDTTGTTINFPFVVGLDNNGEAAKLPAEDLGKNLYNSDGTILGTRNINMNNQIVNITNVPDKSADSTFNHLFATNSSGQWVKANGKNIVKNVFTIFTEAEWLAHRTQANGGWTTGTMSIGSVYPNMVKQSTDYIVIVIRGSNLNINPATSVISLVNTVTQVETVIPNANVNYASGMSGELTFWFKPSDFAEAFYAVRIFNGAATITTAEINTIQLTNIVNNVNLAALTWNKVANTVGQEDNVLTLSPNAFEYKLRFANQTAMASSSIAASAMSSVVVPAGKNFTLKGSIRTNSLAHLQGGAVLGLVDSNATNALIQSALLSVGARVIGGNWVETMREINGGNGLLTTQPNSAYITQFLFIISKRGNLAYVSIQWKSSYMVADFDRSAVFNKTIDPNTPLSILFQGFSGNHESNVATGTIEELYTN